ncbi:hypothetical protein SM14VA2_43740 [Serratia marcescens]|nr:hypothetical protein SM14VA2_43740 [Serratia marcescens]
MSKKLIGTLIALVAIFSLLILLIAIIGQPAQQRG